MVIRIYDSGYRGECNTEDGDLISFMEWVKTCHPERFDLVFHCPNELTVDRKKKGHMLHLARRKKKGVKAGIPDALDIGGPVVGGFELKIKDSSRASVTRDQMKILKKIDASGGFAAICYGYDQIKLAYSDYLDYCASIA